MKRSIFLTLMIAVCIISWSDVPVLVIDSGTDFDHELLAPVANPTEAELNGTEGSDDDSNGYVDDIYGWNFALNTNVLVNLDNRPENYSDVIRFMSLMGKLQISGMDALTQDEKMFLYTNYQNKEFLAWVQYIGGFAHGTHVAGIMAKDNPYIKMKAIAHIPVGEKPSKEIAEEVSMAVRYFRATRRNAEEATEQVTMDDLINYFQSMGVQYAQAMEKEADYVGQVNPRVVNCSFGTENKMLLENFKNMMIQEWGFVDPSDELVQEVVNNFVKYAFLPRDKVLFSKAEDMLVVIAAGNSSEDLTNIVTSPNDVEIENKLVVAATHDDQAIAPFSCYASNKVHVAVPGVNILSSYPGGEMGVMSGTSQAAPYAAKIASMVMGVNPNLTAVETKKILMETVDKKDWLRDKVISGGVINVKRAMQAARYTKDKMTVEAAIAKVNEEISEKPIKRNATGMPNLNETEKEMYNWFAF